MTNEEILKQAKDALDKAIEQKKSNEMLLKSIGPAVIDALKPILNQIKEAVSAIRVDVKPNIQVNPKVDMPRIPAPEVTVNVPDFPKIPEPKVTVNVPEIKIPDLQWPKEKMPIEGWVQLMGVSLQNPLPVQIRDANGKPVDFGGRSTQVMGGSGGGKADFFTIKGFSQSAFSDYLNADGRLRVSVETGTETVSVSGSLDTVKASGVARTINPTAVSDGDNVRFSADKLGRQVMTPLQVRGLRATAYASLTNGTETTLLAAVAGAYLDLIYVMGTNNSDAAVTVDLRAVTAGNVQTSIRIPANGTAGVSLPVPIPQDETGNNWTADLPDITGTTVTLSALFSKEV